MEIKEKIKQTDKKSFRQVSTGKTAYNIFAVIGYP
jgi:hypothetical protein